MRLRPKVSVVVLNWNGKKFLHNCFESIFNQTYKNYEVILVDNGSTDGSVEYVHNKFPIVKIVENKRNLGFAEGNNIGIRNASGNYIILLNNDIKLNKNFIRELVKVADSNKRIGMVAPKIVYFDTDNIDTIGLRLFKSGLAWDTKDPSKANAVIAPCAGAALYKRKMLDDIKINNEYFDKDFFIYCEDLDLGLRAQARKWKYSYAPKAIIHHLHSATMGKHKDRSVYLSHRNNVWVIIKNFPTKVLIKNFLWITLAQLATVLIYVRKGKTKIILKSKIDAIKGLKKILKKRKKIQYKRKITEYEFQALLDKDLFPRHQINTILKE